MKHHMTIHKLALLTVAIVLLLTHCSIWTDTKKYDVVIVGSGLTGSVLAERLANIANKKVLVIEKRKHIGGACYDYHEPKTGILVSAYGIHAFHTNNQRVWDYVTAFVPWQRYEHRVAALVDGQLVTVPVNITTVNMLFQTNIAASDAMETWLLAHQQHFDPPHNAAEMTKNRVGEELYKKIFEPYTIKQWGMQPEELDASVTGRIPVRLDFDPRYFTDRYQALPVHGYTHFIKTLLTSPNIDLMFDTDYFAIKDSLNTSLTIYTGPIDRYFDHVGLQALPYRSMRFDLEIYFNTPYYQPYPCVNYPGMDYSIVRIAEYKHFLHQQSPHTVIVRETPCAEGEPFYPIPTQCNRDLYARYKKYAEACSDVVFAGRLATYKYINMDQAIDDALTTYQDVIKRLS